MTVVAASTAVWVFILIPLIIVWVLGVADIIRRPMSGRARAGWLLVVILLPFIGTLIYFLTRKPTEEEIRRAQQAGADRTTSWPT
jgi:Phospholipase_D-nuclease N-terminal